MNMMFRDWSLLNEVHSRPAPPARFRIVSAGVVVLAHVALALVLLWTGTVTYSPTPAPQPITVDILASAPKQAVMPAAAKVATPQMPVVAVPDFVVESASVQAISVQPPPGVPAPSNNSAATTARDTYFARLIAYLDSLKRYPPEARRLHIEGVVQLRFRLDRAGHVLDYEIANSSGRPILDEEAKALIVRAQPLPPIPADWRETQLSFVVPVEFRLR
jgi:protein TonB